MTDCDAMFFPLNLRVFTGVPRGRADIRASPRSLCLAEDWSNIASNNAYKACKHCQIVLVFCMKRPGLRSTVRAPELA